MAERIEDHYCECSECVVRGNAVAALADALEKARAVLRPTQAEYHIATDALRAAGRRPEPPRPQWCSCYYDCRADSRTGDWHQHEGEPCPVHPGATVVG